MLTSVLAVLTLAKPFALAYTARYYLPGTAKSVVRAYVCDEFGANRTAVSGNKTDAAQVAWAGPGRLVWIENESSEKPELWTATIGGTPTKIQDLGKGAGQVRGWGTTEPGRPVFFEADESAGPYWEVQPDGTTKQVAKPVSTLNDLVPEDKGGGSLTIEGATGKPLVVDFKEDTYSVFRLDGTTKAKLPLPDHADLMLRHIFVPPAKDVAYVVGWTHDSTRGTHFALIHYTFATGVGNSVFEDAGDLDFSPSRTSIAWQTPRDLGPLGTKKVWTSQAWIGDMAAPWRREVVKGTVFVFNLSVRPGAVFTATKST